MQAETDRSSLPGTTRELTPRQARESIDCLVEALGRALLGKERRVRLALACILARGHLLIEDLPGVGKTTLARSLARVLGLEFQRIQFTSDLLPADITGVSVYDAERAGFVFHPGPLFANVVLADEINRATPKAQSALLEAMEEGQVSVDRQSHVLPRPFFVVATQNPLEQVGTYPLPESQLDRFMFRIDLGYPDHAAERAMLEGRHAGADAASLPTCLAPGDLVRLQAACRQVHAAPPLLDYLQRLLDYTRRSEHFLTGLSPRSGLSLLAAARAWAMIHGRDFVAPEDVQALLPCVAVHRLPTRGELGDAEVAELLQRAVPLVPETP